MSSMLVQNSYGKSLVRVTRVTRHADRHDLRELTVAIQIEGDFTASYLSGDNRNVVATDSMKNTVYVLAKERGIAGVEPFGILLAEHFLTQYPQVIRASVRLQEHPWQRIVVDGREHPHAFTGGGGEPRVADVVADRNKTRVVSGFDGLLVLKTTDSAWRDFVSDRYRTLPDADDRIFATVVAGEWTWNRPSPDFDAGHSAIRQALLRVFATHKSLGVQQTLFAMGDAALAACPDIDEIRLTMPNKHRIPMNLAPFGLDNANEVFVTTDEPHGLISGTIRRGD